jgi:DNA-binding MarR family transcriptional regulator
MSSKSQDESKRRHELIERMMFLGQMNSTETALFHQAVAAKDGLSITESKTLSTLMQEGSMTAGQLATRLSLTTGAITSLIDRLENAGYASRTADPHDRRKVIVKVNYENIAPLSKRYDSIGTRFSTLLDSYTTEQLRFLVEYSEASLEVVQIEIKKLADEA